MWKYIARKLLLIVPLVWCVVTLIFVLIELSPGDVADKFFTPETPPEVRTLIVAKYHLDDPSYVRYLAMLRNLVLFDFGRSMTQERPVFEMIAQALPNTILLSLVTLGVVYPTAIVTARSRRSATTARSTPPCRSARWCCTRCRRSGSG